MQSSFDNTAERPYFFYGFDCKTIPFRESLEVVHQFLMKLHNKTGELPTGGLY